MELEYHFWVTAVNTQGFTKDCFQISFRSHSKFIMDLFGGSDNLGSNSNDGSFSMIHLPLAGD